MLLGFLAPRHQGPTQLSSAQLGSTTRHSLTYPGLWFWFWLWLWLRPVRATRPEGQGFCLFDRCDGVGGGGVV
ncbi:hypothetical protein IWX49DRAFT_560600 [Phyllosticta citricarpa]